MSARYEKGAIILTSNKQASSRTLAATPGYSTAARHRIELSAEQVERLDNLTPVVGERHDEGNMAVIHVDADLKGRRFDFR